MATADLQIAIRVFGDAQRDLNNVAGSIKSLGASAASAAPSFNVMAAGMAAGTIAAHALTTSLGGLMNVFKAGAGAGMEFSQSMANMRATLPKADVEAFSGQLEELALKLGKDYPLSASEAGKAMEMLAQKGISAKDILEGGAEAVVKLSSATGGDLVTSANIAAVALDTFNLQASDMGRVTDVMTAAVLRGGMSVEDFGFAMQAGGAAVRLAGGTIEDVSLGLAALAKAGIEGSDAGTSLKTMYMNLIPKSKEAAAMMQQLGIGTMDASAAQKDLTAALKQAGGPIAKDALDKFKQGKLDLEGLYKAAVKSGAVKDIGFGQWAIQAGHASSAFFDAAGNVKSFEEISVILARSVKDLSKEQQLAAFNTMFGSDAIRAAATAARLGAGEFGNLAEAMREQGISSGAAAEKLNTLKGDLANLSGTWETIQVVLFRRVEPALRVVVQRINAMLGAVLDFVQSERFTEWFALAGRYAEDAQDWLLSLREDFLTFGRAVIDLGRQAWPMLLGAMQAAWSYVQGTILPMLPVLIDLVKDGLGAALVWVSETGWPLFLTATTVVASFVMGTVMPAVASLVDWLKVVLPPVLTWIAETGWPMLLGAMQAVAAFVTGTAIPAVAALIGWLSDKVPPAVRAVLTAFEWVRGQLAPVVEAIFKGDISKAIAKLGSAFSAFATLALGWLGEQAAKIDWAGVWAKAKTVTASMAQWFVAVGTDIARWVGEKVAAIDWAAVWAKAQSVVMGMYQWFAPIATEYARWIGEKVGAINWADVWQSAKDVAASMYQWFVDVGTRFAGWISEKVSAINWQDVWNYAVDVAESMWQWFTDVASRFATWIGDQVAQINWREVWDRIVEMTAAMQAAFEREAAKIDWYAVLAAATDAAQQMWRWLNDTVASVDWRSLGYSMTDRLVNAYIEAVIAIHPVTLGVKLYEWIAKSLTAEGMDWSNLGTRFADAVRAMILAIDGNPIMQALGNLFLGILERALNLALGSLKPALPDFLTGGGGTQNTGANVSAPNVGSANYGAIDNSSRQAFIKTAFPYMLDAAGGDRALAEMMMATAISENGDIGKGGEFIGNNFSGIKGTGSAGSFTARTWEMENGQRVYQDAQFAAFKTPQEGMAAFMKFLTENKRYAPALEAYRSGGSVQQLWRDINDAGYATDPEWADTVENIRRNQVAGITSNIGTQAVGQTVKMGGGPSLSGFQSLNQFTLTSQGLSWDDASAACGPTALLSFWALTGRTPDAQEAMRIAKESGWTQGGGMNGVGNFMKMLGNAGVRAALDSTPTEAEIQASLAAGNPVAFSNAQHYFMATGYDPATGKYNVGGSGEALKGGSAWMSLDEIAKLSGPVLHTVTMFRDLKPSIEGAVSAANDARGDMNVLGATFTDVDQAVVTVTTSMKQQYDSFVKVGEANYDLIRDMLPTINALEQQGAISAETAESLRTMGLSVLEAAGQSADAVPSIDATSDAVAGIGQVADTSGRKYGDLASTIGRPLTPDINTVPLTEADAAVLSLNTNLTTVDGQQVNLEIGQQQLDDAATRAAELAATLSKDLNKPVRLGFSADVPNAVTVRTINADTENVDKAQYDTAQFSKGLFDPKFNFNFGGGKASGGPVMAGMTYLVGERGPELLTMGGSGHITPNGGSGGGGPTEVRVFIGQREITDLWVETYDRAQRSGRLN